MEWICKNIIKLQCSCFGYIDQEEADDLLIHENENESEKSRLGLSIFDQAEMIKMVFDELKEENQNISSFYRKSIPKRILDHPLNHVIERDQRFFTLFGYHWVKQLFFLKQELEDFINML